MFKGKVVAFALMLVLATSVYAGDVDDCLSTIQIVGCATMQLNICPNGDYEFIRDACGTGITAYIVLIARDASGVGIPDIPWTDYWLNACDSGKQLALCASPIAADSLTSAVPGFLGRTTFSGRVAGGGCNASALTPGIWWAVQGKTLKEGTKPNCTQICLSIKVKSPDYTKDLFVNPSDLIPMNATYYKSLGQGGYNPCYDFTDDNTVNLSDLAQLGKHYYHKC
jgi:hypothetical protein